jgi:hypothetical protein
MVIILLMEVLLVGAMAKMKKTKIINYNTDTVVAVAVAAVSNTIHLSIHWSWSSDPYNNGTIR